MSTASPSSRAPLFVLVHIGLVMAVVAFIAVSLSQPVGGANIGFGLGMLGLTGLGLPWSLLSWFEVVPVRREAGEVALLTCFALLNIALHVALWWLVARGARRRSPQGSHPPVSQAQA